MKPADKLVAVKLEDLLSDAVTCVAAFGKGPEATEAFKQDLGLLFSETKNPECTLREFETAVLNDPQVVAIIG